MDSMTTVESVLKTKNIEYEHAGINKYSKGPMLAAGGNGFGIGGLKSVVFIFTPRKELTGALLTINKDRYAHLVGLLKEKHRVLDEKKAFVGDQSVTLEASDRTHIQVDAPHMSFEMTISYLTYLFLMQKHLQDGMDAGADRRRESEQL